MVAALLVAAAAYILVPTGLVGGTTLYVGGGGPGNYTTIQAAVNAAISGDTVFVFAGVYAENVMVAKTLSLVGEGRDTTIIDGRALDTTLLVRADWVNVTGFTLRNSAAGAVKAGILLSGAQHARVVGNNVSENLGQGVFLQYGVDRSGNSTIADNDVFRNEWDGIKVWTRDNVIANNTAVANRYMGINIGAPGYNRVLNNTVDSNRLQNLYVTSRQNIISGNQVMRSANLGIYVDTGTDNVVVRNTAVANIVGILLRAAHGNLVARNNASANTDSGIRLVLGSTGNFLVENTALGNTGVGIRLSESSGNVLARNNASNSQAGIGLESSSNDNVLEANEVTANQGGNGLGIYVQPSTGNRAYHNRLIGNVEPVRDAASNAWDDGYPSGGNYWGGYGGVDAYSGPNQDIPGSDGIGDTPVVIDGNSTDRYPFMSPWAQLDLPPGPPRITAAEIVGPGWTDVRVSWSRSPDDGAGEYDLTTYELWSGAPYDATGASYTRLAVLARGVSSYVHAGAGVGDPANHFYRLRAVDAGGQDAFGSEQAGKFARFLAAGDQLLSVPLDLADWNLTAVLQTISWDRARTYRNEDGIGIWLSSFSGRPAAFGTLDLRAAAWVNVTADTQWVVVGIVPASTQLSLGEGWNLIGYPGLRPRAVADVLAGVSYRAVEGFAPVPPYYLRTMVPTDLVTTGGGYWIWAVQPANLTIAN